MAREREIKMELLIILNMIIPFVMILVGNILKKYPVTDMSKHQGYNTPSSRKSQEHWDYVQSIAPDIFIKNGKVCFIVILIWMAISLFININVNDSVLLGMLSGFIFVITSFYKVEKRIKMKFSN